LKSNSEEEKVPDNGVLVTGGTGLVGAYTVSKLLDAGERPIVYDIAINERFLAAAGVDLNSITVVRGDLLDLPGLITVIRDHRVKRIIHLAAFLGEEVERRPYSGVRLNLFGTVNILEAARLEGVSRVVFPSSGVVYFGSLKDSTIKIVDETIPVNPTSIYAATKAGSEFLGRTYARKFGFEFIIVRFASLYGPSPTGLKATREQAIQLMVGAALRNEAVTINWPYAPTALLYGRDASKSAVLACLAENLKDDVFNIGGDEGITGEDIIEALKTKFPQVNITLYKGKKPMPYPDKVPRDISRAREQLGYEPDYPLKKALEDYALTLKKLGVAAV
jgi:nucleoside-diphosphate-sugar epimerase